jgi:hypothetical protein
MWWCTGNYKVPGLLTVEIEGFLTLSCIKWKIVVRSGLNLVKTGQICYQDWQFELLAEKKDGIRTLSKAESNYKGIIIFHSLEKNLLWSGIMLIVKIKLLLYVSKPVQSNLVNMSTVNATFANSTESFICQGYHSSGLSFPIIKKFQ